MLDSQFSFESLNSFKKFYAEYPSLITYILCECLRTENQQAFDCFIGLIPEQGRLTYLKAGEKAGYLKIVSSPEIEGESWFGYLDVRKAFLDLAPKQQTYNAEQWIDEWRNLFPAGVRSGGYPVRGDRVGCLLKMNTFLKKYKYSKETIFKATQLYIEKKQSERWAFMQLAHYFIFKNGLSTLASFCEEVTQKIEPEENNDEFTITI